VISLRFATRYKIYTEICASDNDSREMAIKSEAGYHRKSDPVILKKQRIEFCATLSAFVLSGTVKMPVDEDDWMKAL
jgi:hypothetical protein